MKSNDTHLEQAIERLKSQMETQQRYIDDLELRLTNLTVDLYGHLAKWKTGQRNKDVGRRQDSR